MFSRDNFKPAQKYDFSKFIGMFDLPEWQEKLIVGMATSPRVVRELPELDFDKPRADCPMIIIDSLSMVEPEPVKKLTIVKPRNRRPGTPVFHLSFDPHALSK